jgi:hypothetical protein
MNLRHNVVLLAGAAFLVFSSSAARADSFTFNTIPANGSVAGTAGSTVGWGYSITNLSPTDWLITTAIAAGNFLNGTPNAIFDFPILAPQAQLNVPFNALAGTGLYALTWNITAPLGFVNSGSFVLSADWWTGDPFAGGHFTGLTQTQSAPYSAALSAVPEPSTLSLLIGGLAMMVLNRVSREFKRSSKEPEAPYS